MISVDGGELWLSASIPLSTTYIAPGVAFVLDSAHAWSVKFGPGLTCCTGSDTDIAHYVVARSTNGGSTWQSTEVPGNYADTTPAIAFGSARRGYLLAAADRLGLGVSSVLRTDDGGTTWSVVGRSAWLGSLFAISDASTLWAGGQEQAGGLFAQPILAVSRDSGHTWRDVGLPGVTGKVEVDCGCYLPVPPLFTSSEMGYVTVVSSFGNGPTYTRVERTSDGGRTWVPIADRPGVQATGLAVLDARSWLMPTNTGDLDATSDGGATWSTVSNVSPGWIDTLTATTAVALLPINSGADSPSRWLLVVSTDRGHTWQQVPTK